MTPAYNTDEPFTAGDIERFNRFTHFPKDRAKENAAFAAASRTERAHAEETLMAWGKPVIPDDIARALERVRKARYEVFLANVRSREIAPPWSVVGPARYSEHTNPDRAHRMMGRAFEELNNARAALAHRLRQHGPSNVIRSDDAGAVGQLEAKLEALQRHQEKMKQANAILREEGKDESWRIARLETECGICPGHARQLLKPDFAGRIGFAAFELSNNAANIRRTQDRLAALKAESSREPVTFHFPGGRVEENVTDCRIRIYHEEKPGQDVIARLKGNGFHWSPSLGCWQRLRNNAARHAATIVTGVAWPVASAPETSLGQEAGGPLPKAMPRGGIAV